MYSRITSTKSPLFCMTTFSANLTNLTTLLRKSHDSGCYVSRRTLAPPALWLQKHTDLYAQDFVHSLDLWHQPRLVNVTSAWSWRPYGISPAIHWCLRTCCITWIRGTAVLYKTLVGIQRGFYCCSLLVKKQQIQERSSDKNGGNLQAKQWFVMRCSLPVRTVHKTPVEKFPNSGSNNSWDIQMKMKRPCESKLMVHFLPSKGKIKLLKSWNFLFAGFQHFKQFIHSSGNWKLILYDWRASKNSLFSSLLSIKTAWWINEHARW